jgi:hypothetical protein
MAKNTNDSRLDLTLDDIFELEAFLFALLPAAAKQRPKQGADLLPYAKQLNLKVPESLKGVPITWESTARSAKDDVVPVISMVRPGNPAALGLTIGCTRIGKWKFCLECGWLYCRIVVTRRF